MTPRKGKKFRMSESVADLTITYRHAAGIDVHSAVHFVAVPVEDVPLDFINPDTKLPAGVRKFATNTADLEAIAMWLKACGVTKVAMESTGVYWIPLYDLLASQGFDVILVDPRQTKHAPGRPKSDVLDCQWIRRLHSFGLLTASFRPGDEIVQWRGFQRHRDMLVRYAAQHVQHMQKTLEEINVKLTEVVSDVAGQTGMKIIKDIVRGERDPLKLAKHRHERCKKTEAQIARALYGNWRKEHLFTLKQAVQMYEFYQRQLRACDKEIEACLRGLADKSKGAALPRSARRLQPRHNEPRFGARALLFRMAGVDLTVIEGISETTALVILSEIGTDLSRFATEKNFVSWLGLCPQRRGSAGKIFNRRVRRGANRAARAMRMAAQGRHHAKNALGAFYRRIQARCGGAKAVVATARKIAERVYRLLNTVRHMSLKQSRHTNRRIVCEPSRRWHAKPQPSATSWCRRQYELPKAAGRPLSAELFHQRTPRTLTVAGRGKLLPKQPKTTVAFQPAALSAIFLYSNARKPRENGVSWAIMAVFGGHQSPPGFGKGSKTREKSLPPI